ncbi:hypothetical protein DFH09DRAFT_1326414 [Mycena vulgaris]|nr:hypothetical protein DFH09DRAFT_1326414 [Mycena vulgaris]
MFGRPQSQSQSRSNRFQPFQRPAPLLSGDTSLSDAFQELKLLNGVEGQLCSWGHGLSNAWDIIPRPQRVTNRGLVDVAASSFIKVWGKDGAPIFCPHTRRNGEAYKPLALRLGGRYEGGIADFFHAKDHECVFKVVVRPLKETNYLTSWDEIRQFQDNNKEEDDDNDSELAPESSQTSISSSASATATTSVISQLRVKAMVDPDPRYGRHSTGIAPRPRPCATVIGVGTALQSLSNIEILEFIDQLIASGILAEDPSAHPASDTQQSPPEALQVYDRRIYTRCLERTFAHVQHVYTPLGQAIRALNSAHGIPYADYATLIRYSRSCDSCKNVFSIYGYNDHVVDGRCTNHPDLEEVATLEQDVSPFRFRSFRDGKHPKKIGETLDSPVGAALLEWNSRLGVPTDVWMLISTAVVPCTSCDLSLTLEEQDAAM